MEFDYRTGDCRELLKTVPDASVRLVVTSVFDEMNEDAEKK